jgi:RNA polymerase subunit RPABC4/transcription elongation factor Spt4
VVNTQQAEPAPRPTRIVNSADLQSQAALKATVSQAPKSCPHCGYPVVGDFTSCPNCGASLEAAPTRLQQPQEKKAEPLELDIAEEVKCDKCGTMVSIDFSFCPKCGERIHLPTVRAIRHKPTPPPEPPKPKCHLTIIPEEGEITEVFTNDYEGDSIILNRENTEQGNRTITSKEQAELICEEGKWYVLNRSELGSTYLEANRKLALEPGDVIVLGDRRFRFEAE